MNKDGYRVVLIILYDSQKRFLLQHRSKNARLLPDHWAFFGGGINNGETPEEAVRREAFEELNHKIGHSAQLILEQSFTEAGVEGYMYVYIEAIRDSKSRLRLNEGQGWGWYNKEETAGLRMIERDRKIINFIVSYLEGVKEKAEILNE